ncbi:MAG: Oligopeptidase A, partial [uncultured Gemmatimonadetes bacterium]
DHRRRSAGRAARQPAAHVPGRHPVRPHPGRARGARRARRAGAGRRRAERHHPPGRAPHLRQHRRRAGRGERADGAGDPACGAPGVGDGHARPSAGVADGAPRDLGLQRPHGAEPGAVGRGKGLRRHRRCPVAAGSAGAAPGKGGARVPPRRRRPAAGAEGAGRGAAGGAVATFADVRQPRPGQHQRVGAGADGRGGAGRPAGVGAGAGARVGGGQGGGWMAVHPAAALVPAVHAVRRPPRPAPADVRRVHEPRGRRPARQPPRAAPHSGGAPRAGRDPGLRRLGRLHAGRQHGRQRHARGGVRGRPGGAHPPRVAAADRRAGGFRPRRAGLSRDGAVGHVVRHRADAPGP